MDANIRIEIQEIIEKLPEDCLQPILDYLKEIERVGVEKQETAKLVKKIFEEDARLLKRLAE